MRLMRKSKVAVLLMLPRVLGVKTRTDTVLTEPTQAARAIRRMRGAGDIALTTDEILTLTRK